MSDDEPEPAATSDPEPEAPPSEDNASTDNQSESMLDPGESTPIDPEKVRVDTDVAGELFGDLYTGQTTHGPTQFGKYNTMHNHFGERPLDPIIGDLPGIEGLMAVYVAADTDKELDDLLSQRSVVCLTGPRNSGRYSAARAALHELYPIDLLHEIVLPSGIAPESLNQKPERLPENSGFVLRLSEGEHADAINKLGPLFRRRNSTLLLLRDEESRRRELRGAEVRHRAPDPIEVFRRHLKVLATEIDVARYLTDEVEAKLRAASGPKESVALAQAIAEKRPATEADLHLLLEQSQPQRRVRATAILVPDPGVRGRRASQHERAFRLSYAVFFRRPLHYVFEAADWLLREIDSAALRPDWGNMALQHPVQELLGTELGKDWDTEENRRGVSRTAWMRDPGLRGAIIDVAWHEFDGTRSSVLKWLDRMVVDGDDVMRRAAAETAGLLAYHDFDRVHQDLVDGWAASRRPAVRQAAAWTMAFADMTGDVRPRVQAKLSEWCSGQRKLRRDTAARVYASGLEQAVPAWSMSDLARIAKDPIQAQRHAVAAAVNQLYRPERARWILTELAEWARDPLLRIHAARALVILATRVEPEATDSRPDLLNRLAREQIEVDQLGRLWLAAFLEETTAPGAARALAGWVRHADSDHDLRPQILSVLSAITTRSAVRRRIEFYLKRTTEFRDGLPEWAQHERERDS